jgi:uncharacterized membrane protein
MELSGRPVQEWRKQAFDIAADSTKQLITVAAGVVAATALFTKDVHWIARCFTFVAWIAFVASIVSGIISLLSMSGNLNNAAEGHHRYPDLNASDINTFSKWQCYLFIAAIFFILCFGVSASLLQVPVGNNPSAPMTYILPVVIPGPAPVVLAPAPPQPIAGSIQQGKKHNPRKAKLPNSKQP